MPNDLKKTVLLLIIGLSPLFLAGAQEGTDRELIEQELDWESVEGVWGYEVIIQEGDEEMLRAVVEDSHIKFSLPPGEYEVNIVLLNKFKKSINETGWKPLIILKALQPVVREFTPRQEFLRSSGELKLTAEVFQVRGNTRFFLQPEGGGPSVEGSHRIIGEESVEISFPMGKLKEGDYILSAEDPSGLSDSAEAFPLTLLPIIRPGIEKVSIRKLLQQEVYKDIEITGKNFEEGLSIRILRKGSEFEPYEIIRESDEKIRISVITAKTPPGRYALEVTNPSGESDTRNNSFFIEEAPEKEIVSEIPPLETITLMGGLSFAIPAKASYGEPEAFPFGLVFKARHDLVNALFWRAPGLRYLGIELDMDTSHIYFPSSEFTYNQLYTGLSLYYRIRLIKGWSLIPRAGMGVTLLHVNDDGLFGETIQGDAGYGTGLGLSLQKLWSSGILIEGGLDYRYTRYTGGYFHTVHPWLAGGYRF